MRHNYDRAGIQIWRRDSKRAENDDTSFSARFGSFRIRFCSKHCSCRASKPLIILNFFVDTVRTLAPYVDVKVETAATSIFVAVFPVIPGEAALFLVAIA